MNTRHLISMCIGVCLVVGSLTAVSVQAQIGGPVALYLPFVAGPKGSAALTRPAADFDGDGMADLVIGVPFENVSDQNDAGAINVLYGTAFGLSEGGDQEWHEGTSGVEGALDAGDEFGRALDAGDFNGDGFVDLAIGVPGEDEGDDDNTGNVNILYGSEFQLTANNDQRWDQDSGGISGSNEDDDRFGDELAVGDFNGDGFADLAVGVPGEDIDDDDDAGSVVIIFGSPVGLVATGSQRWDQNAVGLEGSAEDNDGFGTALTVGDFNGDTIDDLAVGSPSEDVAGESDAGIVHVLFGTPGGLTDLGSQRWDQSRAAVADSVESDDRFGDALAAADFNRDGFSDLAVGAPEEQVDDEENAGNVTTFYGGPSGLSPIGSQSWHQDTLTVLDDIDEDDFFGQTLTTGDFDGDGYADLAIGVPREDVDNDNAGAVNVLFGSANGLTDSNNQFWHQDIPGIDGSTEFEGQFGRALTAGDYDSDGFTDLAVGVPGDDVGSTPNGGAVHVIYGSVNGLTAVGNQRWTQETSGVDGSAETDDFFGRVLR